MIFEVLVFLRKTKTSKPFSGRFNTPGLPYDKCDYTPKYDSYLTSISTRRFSSRNAGKIGI